MVGSDSTIVSLDDPKSGAGSEFESAVGSDSALSVGSILGMQADSDSARSVTKEY